MNPIEYTEAGEHTYTLREANGGTASNGITYDGKTYTIVTTITDNGDGTSAPARCRALTRRSSTTAAESDESSVTDQITATKVLTAATPRRASSTELVEGNDAVAAGTNDAEGNINDPIEYTAAGEHTYVGEVMGNAGGITTTQDLYRRDHHHRQR
ncbi:MAG: Spy0128 family protein [Collinsella sp.]